MQNRSLQTIFNLKNNAFCALFILCTTVSYSQDPIFSQFYNAPLQINPAFAGLSEDPVVSFNYRDQGPGLVERFGFPNGAYTTYAASWDQYYPEINSGFGILLLGDTSGEGNSGGNLISTIGASGFYSYNLTVDGSYFIKFGLEAGFSQTRVNWTQLCFLDELQSNLGSTCQDLAGISTSLETPPESLSKTYFDVSMGVMFYSKRYYGGISLKHLNTPDYNFFSDDAALSDGLPVRTTIHGGYQLSLDPTLRRTFGAYVAPNFLYTTQGGLNQLNIGTLVGYQHFFVGGWYRHTFGNPDAFIASFGTSVGKIKFSYSYDITVSSLSINNTRGAHEVGIIYNFARPDTEKVDINNCFSIFR